MAGKLRISGGELRGRYIKSQDSKQLRPSTERVRESVFSSLHSRGLLDAARVLDLYAGSGILGFEALSRGAKNAVFVEQDRERARLIASNSESLGLGSRVEVCSTDVERYIPNAVLDEITLVFSDPPYIDADPAALLRLLFGNGSLGQTCGIVCEGPSPLAETQLQDCFAVVRENGYSLEMDWQKTFGSSAVLGLVVTKGNAP